MKVSEFSVKHPAIITIILIVLLFFGVYSLTGTHTQFMSEIYMPQAIVYTIYPGASAEDIEKDVTSVLEDDFVTLPHFKAIDSSSYNSFCMITITYQDGYDLYDQLEELRYRITQLKGSLPEGITTGPVAIVGGMNMVPIISFAVTAGNDTARITEYLNDEFMSKLTQIDGVSEISIEGGEELEVSVKIDMDALTSHGISVATVYQVLNYGNVTLPLGNASFENREIQVRYSGAFNSIEDIKNLPVGVADGSSIIRIQDIAKVELAYPEQNYYVHDGDNPIVIVNVRKRLDGDTVGIIKNVKKVLAQTEKETGGAVQFHIISDDSRSVKSSLTTVLRSGIMGVIFTILVILLFMADWRATLVISISIPLCILFALIGLKIFDVSLNLMSLSGLVISLGMVVDGSSVMLEQIYRHYGERDEQTGELKYTVTQSIYKGWDEVSASILASSATTMVVFIPIALLTGLIGQVLHDVSIAIILAIFASFLVAVIIVPYLLKLILKDSGPKLRAKPRKFDLAMNKIEHFYDKALKLALDNKTFVIVFAVFLLIFSGFITVRLGIAFIPSTDNGDFYIEAEFPIGTRIEQTREKIEVAQKLMKKYVPEMQSSVYFIGQSQNKGGFGTTTAECAYAHVVLVPVDERKRDVHEIMFQMQEIWSAVLPDSKVSVQNGGFDKLMGYVTDGGGYGITLISEDLNVLYETASGIKEFLESDPEVVTARLDTDFDTSTMIIDMSQEYLSSLGITSYEAGITSAILFQGMDTGRFKDEESGKRYKVRLSSNIADNNISPDTINNIHIITQNGQNVSFANLSDVKVEKSISQINHSDRAKKITVTATLTSENTANVSHRVNEYIAKNPLPNGVSSKAGGVMAMIGDMVKPMAIVLIVAIFLVYVVMVIQFERFRQPLLIMFSIPFCFIGVAAGLLIFGSTLNLLSMLGLISLAGVVVNNGIILVDYINQIRRQRRLEIAMQKGTQDRDGEWSVVLSDEEEDSLLRGSVADGSASRIKPILITTLTTLLGDIPMAVSKGEGTELYAPMGQAIVGGLLTSTLITLILIPVLYYMTEKRVLKKAKLKEIKMNKQKGELNDAKK